MQPSDIETIGKASHTLSSAAGIDALSSILICLCISAVAVVLKWFGNEFIKVFREFISIQTLSVETNRQVCVQLSRVEAILLKLESMPVMSTGCPISAASPPH